MKTRRSIESNQSVPWRTLVGRARKYLNCGERTAVEMLETHIAHGNITRTINKDGQPVYQLPEIIFR